MWRKHLLWRINACYLAGTLLALAGTAIYAMRFLERFHRRDVAESLEVSAKLVAHALAERVPDYDSAAANALSRELGRLANVRVTFMLPDGRVIGDSDHAPAAMDNHGGRPEMLTALAGGIGQSVRFSDTLHRNLLYVAVPISGSNGVVAVARTSMPIQSVEEGTRGVQRHILLVGLALALAFTVGAVLFSRLFSRPLLDMRRTAERLAVGDLSARARIPDDAELAAVAGMMNQMAEQLGERIAEMQRQRNEQEAVLASMVEGVLAVDDRECVLGLNEAAARLFDIQSGQAKGRSVQEVVRNPGLHAFVQTTLAADAPTEARIVVLGREERTLQLHGAPLRDAGGRRIGALVVMNDVTRLVRLEKVRQDFVANASHELKTPITALKGCVETLTDPSLSSDETLRFNAMLARHVERLGNIVEDLLNLSRIEYDTEQGRINLQPGSVRDVLRRAVQNFSDAAAAKSMVLALECEDELRAPIEAALLEQAVGNLLDNAIKYSPAGTRVAVSGAVDGDAAAIRVSDQGPGIEPRHQARIFERFYRVDAARSRALGGTGLGLSIVRHICLAHRGSVSVESTPGAGSTFSLRIPRV
jgi:two-component system phosphate regulon sensor histidine kinase PhoR